MSNTCKTTDSDSVRDAFIRYVEPRANKKTALYRHCRTLVDCLSQNQDITGPFNEAMAIISQSQLQNINDPDSQKKELEQMIKRRKTRENYDLIRWLTFKLGLISVTLFSGMAFVTGIGAFMASPPGLFAMTSSAFSFAAMGVPVSMLFSSWLSMVTELIGYYSTNDHYAPIESMTGDTYEPFGLSESSACVYFLYNFFPAFEHKLQNNPAQNDNSDHNINKFNGLNYDNSSN